MRDECMGEGILGYSQLGSHWDPTVAGVTAIPGDWGEVQAHIHICDWPHSLTVCTSVSLLLPSVALPSSDD